MKRKLRDITNKYFQLQLPFSFFIFTQIQISFLKQTIKKRTFLLTNFINSRLVLFSHERKALKCYSKRYEREGKKTLGKLVCTLLKI